MAPTEHASTSTSALSALRESHTTLTSRLASISSLSPTRPISAPSIPLIDLSPSFSSPEGENQTARLIHSACSKIGFFQISNHGIDPSTCSAILSAAQRFFHTLPHDKKEALHIRHSKLFRGWEPGGYTTINPDDRHKEGGGEEGGSDDEVWEGAESKEGFNWGYEPSLDPYGLSDAGAYVELDGAPPGPGADRLNVWPAEEDMPGFKDAVRNYYAEVLRVARHLFRLFALGLGLEAGYFDEMCSHPGGIGRLLYYPPFREREGSKGEKNGEGQLGLGAHTDYECFTLLLTSSDPGLEVLVPDPAHEGAEMWIPAPVREGVLTVNVADFLSMWTGGEYKSAVHRVVMGEAREGKEGKEGNREGRYSVPFFFSINYDKKVEPLPGRKGQAAFFKPVCAGEYVLERLKATV
ncbi:MAG: hypothetical protein LQ342_006951 [Letrouitia transgressa]|nr:MAG: hypothetical protein LQ342_006951 [Letrouitia transgressa]